MRSTCKICGWHVDYDGAKGDHTWSDRTVHLTDYGPYTNELDAEISECTACGTKTVTYYKGEGWNDYNRYYTPFGLGGNGSNFSGSPETGNFNLIDHPEWQTAKRDFKYDSAGYVIQYTQYWWYNGTRYSQVINCAPGEIEKWFADCGLVNGENIKHYTLKCYGSYLAPYKVSYNY